MPLRSTSPLLARGEVDVVGVLRRQLVGGRLARLHCEAGEESLGHGLGALAQGCPDVALQGAGEVAVALGRDDGEGVHALDLGLAQGLQVLALALAVDAQAQAAPHLLALAGLRVGVLEGADLEHVGVVPALAQGGVREDEPGRLVEGEQALLVPQDEVVSALVVGLVASALDLGVRRPALPVDGEVALVGRVGVDAAQPFQVAAPTLAKPRVERGVEALLAPVVLLDRPGVLLLEDAAVLADGLPPVLVVGAVLGHLVDEEERQALDAAREERLLLLEVAPYGLADLDAAHVGLG